MLYNMNVIRKHMATQTSLFSLVAAQQWSIRQAASDGGFMERKWLILSQCQFPLRILIWVTYYNEPGLA